MASSVSCVPSLRSVHWLGSFIGRFVLVLVVFDSLGLLGKSNSTCIFPRELFDCNSHPFIRTRNSTDRGGTFVFRLLHNLQVNAIEIPILRTGGTYSRRHAG